MFEDLVYRTYLGNSVMDYLVSLAIFLLAMLILYLVRSVVIKKARVLAGKTSTTVDDFLIDTIAKRLIPLMYVSAFYFNINRLDFTEKISIWITGIFIVLISMFILNFEIVFLVLSNDYLHYMNVRHAVNMDIVKRFREEGIEFAFPTQTIELQGESEAGNRSG